MTTRRQSPGRSSVTRALRVAFLFSYDTGTFHLLYASQIYACHFNFLSGGLCRANLNPD